MSPPDVVSPRAQFLQCRSCTPDFPSFISRTGSNANPLRAQHDRDFQILMENHEPERRGNFRHAMSKLFTANHNWPSSDWAGAGHWTSVAPVEKYSYNKTQVSTCSDSTPMEVTDITT